VQNLGARGGANAGGVNVVFQRDGDAVERAEVPGTLAAAFARKRRFRTNGLLQGLLLANGQVGVEAGIQPGDAIKQEAREFDGRELATAVEAGNFSDRGEGELDIDGISRFFPGGAGCQRCRCWR